MKKVILLLLIIAFTNTGCEKQEVLDELAGEWAIYSISGSIMGWPIIRDFDGITFTRSGRYTVNYNGAAVLGGPYRVEKQMLKKYGNISVEFKLYLHETFNNNPYANFYTDFPFDIIFYSHDSLTLSQTDVSDGFNYHLVRK